MQIYLLVRKELTNIGHVLLRGTRIVVPKVLQKCVLDLAHEGHPGIAVMKRRPRSKVWCPGIDKDVELCCKCCCGCLLVSKPIDPELMGSTALPSGPWQDVTIDLLGPLPRGDNIFVAIDYFSRYLELDVMKTVTTEKVIESLAKMFATHGLLISKTSDNGPQFVSEEFKRYG